MNTTLPLALLSLLPALAFADDPAAHAPRYVDRAWWPAVFETDRAAYAREEWPSAPVLVWAGASAAGKASVQVGEAALDDPENWRRADGQPVDQGPDAGTDVVFPSGARLNIKPQFPARHVTLLPGSNVTFNDLQMEGNLWVRKGARLGLMHGRFGAPDKDTFVRSDNEDFESIWNYLRVNKRPDKSAELLGKWKIGDQVFLHSGQFVLGPGSTFQHTDRFPHQIAPKGALVLLSGATYESRGNYYQNDDLTVQGALLAGTPERPLSRDATIGLSFKAQGKGKASGSNAVKNSKPDDAGLLVASEGRLAVHSADATKARLVFRWHRNPQVTFAWGAEKRDGKGTGIEPPDIAALPHGIRMRLLGESQLNGVVFNDVLKGGIELARPEAAQTWRNVTLGQGNFGATLEELVTRRQGGGRM